jgi:hypothetical protein
MRQPIRYAARCSNAKNNHGTATHVSLLNQNIHHTTEVVIRAAALVRGGYATPRTSILRYVCHVASTNNAAAVVLNVIRARQCAFVCAVQQVRRYSTVPCYHEQQW